MGEEYGSRGGVGRRHRLAFPADHEKKDCGGNLRKKRPRTIKDDQKKQNTKTTEGVRVSSEEGSYIHTQVKEEAENRQNAPDPKEVGRGALDNKEGVNGLGNKGQRKVPNGAEGLIMVK